MDDIGMTRKERERIRHKTEILSNALDLFSEKGFHNVAMQDIAAHSEYAVGTLYNFFQSKEQLFEELRKECAEKILKVLVPILDNDESEDVKLRKFIMSHSDLAEENLKFIKLYVSQYGTLTPSQSASVEEAYRVKSVLDKKLCDVINSGIAKKTFKSIDSEIFALSLSASLEAYIMESSKSYDKSKVRSDLAKIEKLFLGILINEK